MSPEFCTPHHRHGPASRCEGRQGRCHPRGRRLACPPSASRQPRSALPRGARAAGHSGSGRRRENKSRGRGQQQKARRLLRQLPNHPLLHRSAENEINQNVTPTRTSHPATAPRPRDPSLSAGGPLGAAAHGPAKSWLLSYTWSTRVCEVYLRTAWGGLGSARLLGTAEPWETPQAAARGWRVSGPEEPPGPPLRTRPPPRLIPGCPAGSGSF